MLHIYAALAEKERALISERTKAGLAARRRRAQAGRPTRKGNPEPCGSRARAEALRPVLAELAGSPRHAIAAELTARGIPSQRRQMARGDGAPGAAPDEAQQ